MPLRSYIAMQKGNGEKTVSYWQSNEIKRLYDVLVLQLIENRKWCQEVKRSGRYKIFQREAAPGGKYGYKMIL